MVVPTLGSLLRKNDGLFFKLIFGQKSMHSSLLKRLIEGSFYNSNALRIRTVPSKGVESPQGASVPVSLSPKSPEELLRSFSEFGAGF